MFVFAYGLAAYLVFVATILYTVGFVANALVPRAVDGPGAAGGARAWLVDGLLLGAFALQHSLMARPAFKRRWTRLVPPVLERSTYVLLSSLLLLLLFRCWQPIPGEIWDAGRGALARGLQALQLASWVFVLASSLLLGHLELFGLKQVWLHLRRRPLPAQSFRTPLFYRWVRHPVYLGFLLAIWCTPRMSLGHLFFSAVLTLYLLVAIRFEERDLAAAFPEYEAYRARVPMLFPLPKRSHP
jgi:protein-S-isoprenylcysteine O-methyltransferase Ste14